MVGRVGVEPTTNWLKANCSTTELTTRNMVGVGGFELPTSCSQSRRATGLRYTPDGSGSATWTRTRDPMINSHLLYRLSYRGTSVFQILQLPVKPETPLQWTRILRREIRLSTHSSDFFCQGCEKNRWPVKGLGKSTAVDPARWGPGGPPVRGGGATGERSAAHRKTPVEPA